MNFLVWTVSASFMTATDLQASREEKLNISTLNSRIFDLKNYTPVSK